MNRSSACFILGGSLLAVPTGASAYMGPAFGLGVVGTILAILVVSVLSLVAFVVLPIRRMIRKSKQTRISEDSDIER